MAIQRIRYVTSSDFKRAENDIFVREAVMDDGTAVAESFAFEIWPVAVPERLEIQLELLVTHEVQEAYGVLRVPCIVEHAGLVFEEHVAAPEVVEYPGGLTKPMWNALGDRFLVETNGAGRRATARAVVAYCDGQRVVTFVGDTRGHLADRPRGDRAFYWDTVFIPDRPDGSQGDLTYAEIVADESLGLRHKVLALSQSSRALLGFLQWLKDHPGNLLWPES